MFRFKMCHTHLFRSHFTLNIKIIVFKEFALFLRALRDADKAINIASDWPKGYFRKGRALAGLKASNHQTVILYDIP